MNVYKMFIHTCTCTCTCISSSINMHVQCTCMFWMVGFGNSFGHAPVNIVNM